MKDLIMFWRPRPPLSQYIKCFWYLDQVVPYTREKILPTATIELIINFGAPFHVYDNHRESQFDVHSNGWIVGFHTQYIQNEITGNSHMIGVRFKPHGAWAFLGLPLNELANQIIDMDCIWGYDSLRLRERLCHLPDVQSKIRLLESWLLQRMTEDVYKFELVDFAYTRLQTDESIPRIRQLSDEIGVSQKHLNHLFNHVVGVSPKTLARVLRLQQVLHHITPTDVINWTNIAHRFDYYDQAHFNKDFRLFTGLNPSQYIELRQALFSDVEQGEAVHFVPTG